MGYEKNVHINSSNCGHHAWICYGTVAICISGMGTLCSVISGAAGTGLETTLALRTPFGQLDHAGCRIRVLLKMLLYWNDKLLGERAPIEEGWFEGWFRNACGSLVEVQRSGRKFGVFIGALRE
jgi:hypothetical protein